MPHSQPTMNQIREAGLRRVDMQPALRDDLMRSLIS